MEENTKTMYYITLLYKKILLLLIYILLIICEIKCLSRDLLKKNEKNIEESIYLNNRQYNINNNKNINNKSNEFLRVEKNIGKYMQNNVDQNIKNNIDTNMDNNTVKSIEKNLSEYVDTNINNNISKNIEKNTKKNVDNNIEKRIDKNIPKIINKNMENNIENAIEKNIGKNTSKLNYKKIGHTYIKNKFSLIEDNNNNNKVTKYSLIKDNKKEKYSLIEDNRGKHIYYPELKLISLNKRAEASSFVKDKGGFIHSPNRVNDGDFLTILEGRRHCFHSKNEDNPFIMIDLEKLYTVLIVILSNRSDNDYYRYHEQLHKYNIFVTKHKYTDMTLLNLNDRCGLENEKSPGSGGIHVINCLGRVGRYVYIYINDKKSNLHLCEVQVYGKEGNVCEEEFKEDKSCIENRLSYFPFLALLSRKKPVEASSIYIDKLAISHIPEYANDGHYHTALVGQKNCFASKEEYQPYWLVDLESAKTVFAVLILNRSDIDNYDYFQLTHRINIIVSEEKLNKEKFNDQPIDNMCGKQYNDALTAGEFIFIDCKRKVGRYVYIYVNDTSSSLQLCEVEVYGDSYVYCDGTYKKNGFCEKKIIQPKNETTNVTTLAKSNTTLAKSNTPHIVDVQMKI